MRKVLVITYYWPPAGGGGVQRVVKFCKYLSCFGWEPVVLTVTNPNYENIDTSLMEDAEHVTRIYKANTLEPHIFYDFFMGKPRKKDPRNHKRKKTGKLHWIKYSFGRFADFIRLNLFIPDARIGWLRDGVRTARTIVKEENIDLVFSSAPPYTAHLIAKQVKKDFKLPWVADFRDPWLENLTYNTTLRMKLAQRLNQRLEAEVLSQADMIVTVGSHLKQLLLSKIHGGAAGKCQVITNGYDVECVAGIKKSAEHFYISYFGTLYPQNFPVVLLKAIQELVQSNQEIAKHLVIRVVGNLSNAAVEMFQNNLPERNVSFVDYVPHSVLMESLLQEQVLLLIINDVHLNELIITGKIFEYLPTGNPILGIGPNAGDAAAILDQTGTGVMFGYDDITGIQGFILEKYQKWKEGQLFEEGQEFPEYTRKQLAGELAALFDKEVLGVH